MFSHLCVGANLQEVYVVAPIVAIDVKIEVMIGLICETSPILEMNKSSGTSCATTCPCDELWWVEG